MQQREHAEERRPGSSSSLARHCVKMVLAGARARANSFLRCSPRSGRKSNERTASGYGDTHTKGSRSEFTVYV